LEITDDVAEGATFCESEEIAMNLKDSERRVFGQNFEDGVIEKMFEVIEPTNKILVDFGANDGVYASNSRNLFLAHGWGGLLLEADDACFKKCSALYAGNDKVSVIQALLTPDNIEHLLASNSVPKDFDFLSVDIDSYELYIWEAILRSFRPKVVCIEYNGSFAPPISVAVPYNRESSYMRDGDANAPYYSDFYGASLQALYDFGKKSGYDLVYCESVGVNAFFVDRQFYARFGVENNDPAVLYRPPMYGFPPCRHPLRRYKGGRAPNGRGWGPSKRWAEMGDLCIPKS
jgi:hypothetical protein